MFVLESVTQFIVCSKVLSRNLQCTMNITTAGEMCAIRCRRTDATAFQTAELLSTTVVSFEYHRLLSASSLMSFTTVADVWTLASIAVAAYARTLDDAISNGRTADDNLEFGQPASQPGQGSLILNHFTATRTTHARTHAHFSRAYRWRACEMFLIQSLMQPHTQERRAPCRGILMR